jgi:hypothetical protein
MPDPRNAAECRHLAAEFRERATRAPLLSLRESYLKLAASYEYLAGQREAAEQGSAPHQGDGSTG